MKTMKWGRKLGEETHSMLAVLVPVQSSPVLNPAVDIIVSLPVSCLSLHPVIKKSKVLFC